MGWCIGKAKGHNQILIESVSGGKGRLGDITWSDLNLVITRTEINLGEHSGSSQLIKQDINAGK